MKQHNMKDGDQQCLIKTYLALSHAWQMLSL